MGKGQVGRKKKTCGGWLVLFVLLRLKLLFGLFHIFLKDLVGLRGEGRERE